MMLATAFDATAPGSTMDLGSSTSTTTESKLEWFLPEDEEIDQTSFDVSFQFDATAAYNGATDAYNGATAAAVLTNLNDLAAITTTPVSATLASINNNIGTTTTSINHDFPWLEKYITDAGMAPSLGSSMGSLNSQNDDAVAKLFGSVALLPGSRLSSSTAQQLSQGSFVSSLPLTPPQSPPLQEHKTQLHAQPQVAPQSNFGNGFVLDNAVNVLSAGHMDVAAMEICDDMNVMVTTAFGTERLYTAASQSPVVGEVVTAISPMNSIEIEGPPISPLSEVSITPSLASSVDDDSRDPTYAPDITVYAPERPSTSTGGGGPRKRGRKPDKATAYLSKAERKRLQNKKAATRYRQKLRENECKVSEEEEGLLEKNRELKAEVEKLETTRKNYKDLLRDMLRERGIKF